MSSEVDHILMGVWNLSWVLALTALGIACSLAFKRWLAERRTTRLKARQKLLSSQIQALLASPRELDGASVPPLETGDEPVLLNIALDILRVTRGRDAARMLALTELWNLRPYLKKLLSGRNRNRKIRALTLLAHFQDQESLDLLLTQVGDKAIYVQLAAVRGIADRGDLRNLPLIVEALAGTRATNVPLLADTLRRFGEAAVPDVSRLALEAGTQEIRLAAVTALGMIGSLSAFPALAGLVEDPFPPVRRRALHALAQLGDHRAEPFIRRGLQDEEPQVRTAAAKAAGVLGLRGMLAALLEALGDEVWEVRYRAADSLYQLGAPGQAALRAVAAGHVPGQEGGPAEGAAWAAGMAAGMLAEKTGVSS